MFNVCVADTSASQLFAFERDRKRFTTLQSMLSKAGCKNTEALNVDFTNIEPTNSNYSQVTHMYFFHPLYSSEVQSVTIRPASWTLHAAVPASSIGSTIFLIPVCRSQERKMFVTHTTHTEEETDSVHQDRLSKLSAFQLTMIKHAMKCPSAFYPFVGTDCSNSFLTCSPFCAENCVLDMQRTCR